MSGILAGTMRGWRLVALLVGTLFVLASVSVTTRYSLEIVDPQGRPQVAYAIYNHQGSRPNFVHPLSYDATPRTVLRGGADGSLTFPAALHVHRPFPLETHPALWIEMVYVPALHNAGGRMGGGYAASVAGAWEMDEERRRATVFDLSDRPELWHGTLSDLSFHIGRLIQGSPSAQEAAPAHAAVGALVGHYRAEYEAFLARWGDTARPRPEMPAHLTEEERQRWVAMVEDDLTRRPTWGAEIRRRYEREMSSLARFAAP